MGSAGFLVVFGVVNASNFVKSKEVGSSKIISSLGFLACLFALGTLIWHTLITSPDELWVLFAMVAVATFMEGAYILFWKKPESIGRIKVKN